MPKMGALAERGANIRAARYHLQVTRWWAGVTRSASANQKRNRLIKLLSHLCSFNTHLVPSSRQQLPASGHGNAGRARPAFPLPAVRALHAQVAAVNLSFTELVQLLVAANFSLASSPLLPPPSLFLSISFHACFVLESQELVCREARCSKQHLKLLGIPRTTACGTGTTQLCHVHRCLQERELEGPA